MTIRKEPGIILEKNEPALSVLSPFPIRAPKITFRDYAEA